MPLVVVIYGWLAPSANAADLTDLSDQYFDTIQLAAVCAECVTVPVQMASGRRQSAREPMSDNDGLYSWPRAALTNPLSLSFPIYLSASDCPSLSLSAQLS